MATEQIVLGRHYRVMNDLVNKIWNRVSFWKKAQDVEFNDGRNLQDVCGSIIGITDSLTSDSSNVVASSYAVKLLNDKILDIQYQLEYL